MRRFLLAILLAGGGFAAAQDAPVPAIRLPDPDPVTPLPPPISVVKLDAAHLYIIDSDLPLVLVSSPAGSLRFSEEAGPIKIRGAFVGSDTVTTKTFKGKHVYTVEAAADGRVELLVIPVGLKAEGDIIRRMVDASLAPQPPPKPDPKPDPKPQPVPGTQEFWVIAVEESAARTPAVARVVMDKAYQAKLAARGHQWRLYDRDAADAQRFAVMLSDTPGLIVMDAVGKRLYTGKLPATTADLDAIIKQAGGK